MGLPPYGGFCDILFLIRARSVPDDRHAPARSGWRNKPPCAHLPYGYSRQYGAGQLEFLGSPREAARARLSSSELETR